MASLTGASRPSPNSTIPTKRISVRGLDSPTARTSGDIKPYSAAALASFMIGRSALCIPTCARTLPSLRKRAFAASSTQGQSSVLRQVPIFNMHWVAADWLTAIPLIQVLLSAWLPTGLLRSSRARPCGREPSRRRSRSAPPAGCLRTPTMRTTRCRCCWAAARAPSTSTAPTSPHCAPSRTTSGRTAASAASPPAADLVLDTTSLYAEISP